MKVTIGSGNVTKVTVNTGANVVFAPATDRSPAAAITIGTGGGGGADVTLAYTQANAAYNVANAAANTVRVSANSESTLSKKQLNFVNTASIQVSVEEYSGNANISFITTGAAVSDAYQQANNARNQANTARDTANGAYSQANGSYAQANGAYSQANGAYSQANGAYTQANGAYAQANGAYSQANLAYGQANAAYNSANTRVLKTGDTMTGNLIVQANVSAYNVNVSNSLYFSGDTNGGVKFNYDVGFGPVPYFGMVSPDTETLKIRTNISSGNLNTDVITIDRQTQSTKFNGFIHLQNVSQILGNGNYSTSGSIELIPNYLSGYGLGQYLVIRPTTVFDANHIHIEKGGPSTDLFLGNDDQYVKVANTGEIQIKANNGVTEGVWVFANNGHTYLPNTAYQTIYLGSRSFIKYLDDQILQQSGNAAPDTFYTITQQEDRYWESYTQKDVTGGNSAWSWIHSEMSDANNPYVLIETKKLDSPVKTWLFNANGALTVPGDIIPDSNIAWNLGSPTNKFNDLYLSGNSVFIGDAVLSTNADSVTTNTFTAAVSFLNGGLNVLNQANAAYDAANNAGINALNAYSQANTARNQANTARDTANNAYDQANAARGQANTAYSQANAAYAEANLKLNITGGTINGSLNVSGNLAITGNTTYYNVTTYVVDDPLIYIAANNKTSDLVDIGFIGAKNTAGQYNHTGFARDAGDGTWYLFDNLADEGHQNNVIDFANTTLATLRANINANSILLVGNPVATQANLTLSYDQANSARNQANTAYGQANSARDQANTARTTANDAYAQANTARDQANTARDTANSAYGQANSSTTNAGNAYDQANNARNQANTAYSQGNSAYGQANSARDQANTAYGQGNSAYGQANSARNQANTAYGQANAAYAQANSAYADSNTRVLKAGDTMTGALTITTSGIGLTVANANVTGNLNVGTQIVTSGSSGDISGVNTIYASTFTSGTINVTAQAANAYDQANNARNQANTAYGQGNSAYGQANSARDQANTAYGQANTARDQANTARTTANDAYLQANTARTTANDSYSQANTARNTANDAYGQANAAYNSSNNAANTVRVSQNSSGSLSAKQLNFVNTSSILAIVNDALDGNANISFTTTGASAADAYNQANTARDTANSAYGQANNAYNTANNATVRVSANSGTPITSNTFVFNNSSTISVTVDQSGSNANITFASTGADVEYTYNTTTTSIETIDTFSKTQYRSAKYQIQVENSYGFAALEIMILHNGATTNLVEFGKTTIGGGVGTFSSDISGNDVRLRFTAASDPTTTLSFYKSLLTARGSESLPTDLMTGTQTYDLMDVLSISPTDLNA